MVVFRLTVTINLQVIDSPRSFRSGYFKIAKACTKHEPRDKEAKRRSPYDSLKELCLPSQKVLAFPRKHWEILLALLSFILLEGLIGTFFSFNPQVKTLIM